MAGGKQKAFSTLVKIFGLMLWWSMCVINKGFFCFSFLVGDTEKHQQSKSPTHPVVWPHVLLSNPQEVLQWSFPTCTAETHSSDEPHWEKRSCTITTKQTVLLVWVFYIYKLSGLSTPQSGQSWLKSVLVCWEMKTHGLIRLHCKRLRRRLVLFLFAQDNLLQWHQAFLWRIYDLLRARRKEVNTSTLYWVELK